MTTQDLPHFQSRLLALASAFNRDVDEATAEAYWIGLNDLTLEQVGLAVTSAIRQCKWMPAPAMLRELVGVMPPGTRQARRYPKACELREQMLHEMEDGE